MFQPDEENRLVDELFAINIQIKIGILGKYIKPNLINVSPNKETFFVYWYKKMGPVFLVKAEFSQVMNFEISINAKTPPITRQGIYTW